MKIQLPTISKQKLLEIVLVICVLSGIGIFFYNQASKVPLITDEVSWFFHTEFADAVFINHNFSPQLWLSQEAFDHPPVMKYVFGIYLEIRYPHYAKERSKLLAKFGRWKYYDAVPEKQLKLLPFAAYIYALRFISVIFSTLIGLCMYLLMKTTTKNTVISLVMVVLLAINSVFYTTTLRVTSDAGYILFFLLALLAYIQYQNRKRPVFLYLFGLCAGLSIATKLTGVFIGIGYGLFVSSKIGQRQQGLLRECMTIVCIVLLVWWVVNPTLYLAPLKGTKVYALFRGYVLASQQQKYPQDILATPSQKAQAVVCTILVTTCHSHPPDAFNGSLTPVGGINCGIVLLGIWYFVKHEKKREKERLLLTVSIGLTAALYMLLALPMKWERYFLPVVMLVLYFQVLGCYAVYWYLKPKVVHSLRRISML